MNKYSTDILKTVELSKNSDQYKRIVHSLRLAILLPNVDIRVSSISNIQIQSAEFEKMSEGKLVLESWLDKSKIADDEFVEQIMAKGTYDITPDRPRQFVVGTQMDDDEIRNSLNPNQEFQFILNKIVVGKTYLVYDEYKGPEYREEIDRAIKSNYDSLVIKNLEQRMRNYRYKYVLFNKYQVQPQVLVKFKVHTIDNL